MMLSSDKKAFSLTELLITSSLLIALFSSALTGFVLLKDIFATNSARAMFQRDAAVIMNKIIEGKSDPNGVRLSETASVTFYADPGKLTYAGTDGIQRTYALSGGGTSIIYTDDNGIQKIIYTAPQGAIIGLRFTPVNLNPTLCVDIYITISKTISGRTALGALESSIYLRNHAV